MADTFEGEDLLYHLAYECEALFDKLQDILRKTKSSDAIVRLCSEFQQRFAIWAAHLGVFARKSQCLDTRLRNLPDLQDLVARLLDILRHSLQQCMVEPPSQAGNYEMLLDIHDLPPEGSQIQTVDLKTIDDTLTRLNRLGVTIRQSGRGKLNTRAKQFAAGLDLSSFEHLCATAVQALYPGAHQSLKDHLSRSMMDRYSRMLFLDSRHQKLQARREVPIGLPPIHEVPNDEMTPNNPSLQPRMAIRNRAVQKLFRQPVAPSQSDLSSVNLQQIRSRLRPPDEASTKLHKTSSIQVNQGNYPRIPATEDGSTVITCQWCSEPLIKKTLSESEWRRHIDRDLKPYICLSEACPDDHPAYATFDEWYKHMELHDRRWHQRAYLTFSWVCDICEFGSGTYASPQALYLHLEESHGQDFTHPQLQAISRLSKTEQPRASNDCLLCCFAVEEQGEFGQAVFPKRRKGQMTQKASKSARNTLGMAHPSPHNPGSDLSDTSSASDDMGSGHGKHRSQGSSMAVNRHVAVHLQGLMLLTLRFAAALQDNDGDVNDDAKSNSVDIDEGNSASGATDLGRLSHIVSDGDVTMEDESDEGNTEGNMDFVESLDDDITPDDMPVPDTDIDLKFVPRQHDNLAVEDDEFLKGLIESGDFLYGEDVPKEFSISRAIMAATRVALTTVNIIDGISFDLSNVDDGDGDGASLPSHPGDHINDTPHDPEVTEQLPDEMGKSFQPNINSPGEGARSMTMENSYGDDDRNNTEGAQTAEGVTITDLMLGYGPLAQEGDTVRVSRVARLQNGEGFDAVWKKEVSDRVVLGRPRFVGRPDDIFQCWDLGVIGMAIDGERRLTIPAHLANHKRVIGVPPNCQLTFDIRLLDILDESIKEADSSGRGTDQQLESEQHESPNEAAEFKRDSHQHEGSPSSLDKQQTQTSTDEYDVEFVEAQTPASMEGWLQEPHLKWGSPPPKSDMGASRDEDKKLKLERSKKSPQARQPGQAEHPKTAGPAVRAGSDIEQGTDNGRDNGSGFRAKDMNRRKRPSGQAAIIKQVAKAVQNATGKRPEPRHSGTDRSAALSSNLVLQPAPGRQLEHSAMESPRPVSKTGPGGKTHQDEQLPKIEENPEFKNARGASAGSRDKRVEEPHSLLVFGEETHQMSAYSTEAERVPETSTRPSHESEITPSKSADADEDSPPRLKRVGHVQFDGFAGKGGDSPSNSDDAASGDAEESGYPLDPSSADATGKLGAGTPPGNLAKSGNPFRNPFGETEDFAIVETEKHTCTLPGCGKTVKDLKAHMITHQMERLEKCPFITCRYHTKGFAHSYDKNRHLFIHHRGLMICGFCPGSGSGTEMSFDHLDAFEEHLLAVHGVEKTSVGGRPAKGSAPMAPKTLAYAPDATGTCSICGRFFTNAQVFYEHLDDCMARIVQQVSLPNPDEDSNERPRRLGSVLGEQQGNPSDESGDLVAAHTPPDPQKLERRLSFNDTDDDDTPPPQPVSPVYGK